MKKILFYTIMALLMSSCATQTFSVDSNTKREIPRSNPHFVKWNNFFISGIGQSDFQNASQLCKESGGVEFVQSKQTVGQVLVAVATYGIYSPRTMSVFCKQE